MNYHKIHDQIIINAKLRGKPTGYYEEHHIIPKSFYGGKYKSFILYPWNRAYLTAKEHFIVHKLLIKMYKDNDSNKHRSMVYAIRMMSRPCAKDDNRIKLTASNYEFIKKELSLVSMSSDQRRKLSESKIGKPLSEDHKLAVSNSLKGRIPWNKGIACTDETKAKLSIALKGEKNPFYGKKHSQEAIEQIRTANTGKHFRPHTEEAKKKIRASKLGELNPNYGKPATNFGISHSDETKKKISEKAKARGPVSEIAKVNMAWAAERENLRKLSVLFTV